MEGGAGTLRATQRDTTTLVSPKPERRVLLRARARLLLCRPNALRHPAGGRDRGRPRESTGCSKGELWGVVVHSALRAPAHRSWLGRSERALDCPGGGLDSVLT